MIKIKNTNINEIIEVVKKTGSIHKAEKILGISHKTIERRLKKHSKKVYYDLIKTKKQLKEDKISQFESMKNDIVESIKNISDEDEKRLIIQSELRRNPTLILINNKLTEKKKSFDNDKMESIVNFIYDLILNKNLSPRSNNIVASCIVYSYYFETRYKMTLKETSELFGVTIASMTRFFNYIGMKPVEILKK